MMLQYLLFWGMECGLSLLRERQRRIWTRIRTGPASLSAVLLGRACSTAAIGSLQIAATFGFGYIVFGVTITGSVAGFLLLAAGICLLSAGVGLLVASVGQTEAGARSMLHRGHPRRVDAWRALVAGFPSAELGAKGIAGSADELGDARTRWSNLAGDRVSPRSWPCLPGDQPVRRRVFDRGDDPLSPVRRPQTARRTHMRTVVS